MRATPKIDIEYMIDGRTAEPFASRPDRRSAWCPQWHPGWGWPVAIPPTRPSAYVSGYKALNLPSLPGDRDRGDWHEPSTWWTQTYVSPRNEPYTTELWGSDGSVDGAPGTPELRDARPSLETIEHPSAAEPGPVHAATVPQAILDLAWRALNEGQQPPDRHETSRWLSEEGEAHALRLARAAATRIRHTPLRERWLEWTRLALETEETLRAE